MSEDGDKAPIVEDAGIDDHEVTTKPKGKAGAKGRTSVGAKKAPAEDIKFEYGDIVLARLRGYPPWREYQATPSVGARDEENR